MGAWPTPAGILHVATLVADPAAVTWTDVVSAAAALLGATVVGVSAWIALIQLRRNRRARQARWAIDLQREWDEQLAPARRAIAGYGTTPDELRVKMKELWTANDPDYYECLREPGYWDRVAVLVKTTELSDEALHLLTGPDAIFRWSLWEPTISGFLRAERGFTNAFDQFEWLTKHVNDYRNEYKCPLSDNAQADYEGPR